MSCQLPICNIETNYATTSERLNECGRFRLHTVKPVAHVRDEPGFTAWVPEWAEQLCWVVLSLVSPI